ncbi:PH domain-containing protein [Actinoplanes bogorensis]|uniref:PH domain-containing protein n=1 Tax=Paractinoplanes bogorensis TaxID=1610840 RepID=A0ABS5YYD6_9ACTN|nr:PH domain-containing protein [Actinoplanes bogorensis]MBU2668091.1 PH domain-containing protein [Actinoplanes bogorensis]
MRNLPWRFRTPKGIYGGLAALTFVLVIPLPVAYYEDAWPAWVRAAVISVILLLLAALWARVPRMGTIITEDRVTRRSLFGTRHHTWDEIVNVDIHVNNSVAMVGPFQVAPHLAVYVRTPGVRTLHFFDDRAYRSPKDMEREYNEFLDLWHRRRSRGPA